MQTGHQLMAPRAPGLPLTMPLSAALSALALMSWSLRPHAGQVVEGTMQKIANARVWHGCQCSCLPCQNRNFPEMAPPTAPAIRGPPQSSHALLRSLLATRLPLPFLLLAMPPVERLCSFGQAPLLRHQGRVSTYGFKAKLS